MIIRGLLLSILLAGCQATDWDAYYPAQSYILKIEPPTSKLQINLKIDCEGLGRQGISTVIAQEINRQTPQINSNYEFSFNHSGYHYGGRISKLGPFENGIDMDEHPIVRCSILQSGKGAAYFFLDDFKEERSSLVFQLRIEIDASKI